MGMVPQAHHEREELTTNGDPPILCILSIHVKTEAGVYTRHAPLYHPRATRTVN